VSQKIKYATIIFPNHVYDEIQLLQKKLSRKDNKIWSVSNTINLLLRFCLHEENDLIYAQNYSFLRGYMYEKESFLEDFTLSVFRSTCLKDYDRQSFKKIFSHNCLLRN
jgi:hypothetical protein